MLDICVPSYDFTVLPKAPSSYCCSNSDPLGTQPRPQLHCFSLVASSERSWLSTNLLPSAHLEAQRTNTSWSNLCPVQDKSPEPRVSVLSHMEQAISRHIFLSSSEVPCPLEPRLPITIINSIPFLIPMGLITAPSGHSWHELLAYAHCLRLPYKKTPIRQRMDYRNSLNNHPQEKENRAESMNRNDILQIASTI